MFTPAALYNEKPLGKTDHFIFIMFGCAMFATNEVLCFVAAVVTKKSFDLGLGRCICPHHVARRAEIPSPIWDYRSFATDVGVNLGCEPVQGIHHVFVGQ